MPCLHQESHGKRRERRESRHQHGNSDEFQGAAVDEETHEHGVYKGEAVHIHEDAVGKRQEPETGKDGKRIGKGSFQGFLFHQSLLESKTNGV
jgi:hypothetical protein